MAWLLTLAIAGCGGAPDDRPEVAPVTGTVTYKGDPVAGADVVFVADGAPRRSTGKTDSAGKFTLTTFDPDDGAIVGENKIVVTKYAAAEGASGSPAPAPEPGDPSALMKMMEQSKNAPAPKLELPAQYATETSTPLKETVKADGGNDFTINLVD